MEVMYVAGAPRPDNLDIAWCVSARAGQICLPRSADRGREVLSSVSRVGFPQNMQPLFPAIHNGGTTVNGVHAPTTGFGIEKGDQPY